MMRISNISGLLLLMLVFVPAVVSAQSQDDSRGIVDEVVWVVGDEAILRSDVETMRQQMQEEGTRWTRDPDCAVPEQLAVQKLFLHQAAIDSIEVTESEIASSVDRYIEFWISQIGSREKLEEYKKASITQLRAEMHDPCRDRLIIERMREHLVKDVKVSPAEVRRYLYGRYNRAVRS